MQLSLLSALLWLQRSFPLTEEEYLLHLDDIANTLKGWGAVSHIRSSLAKTKERPRIGKVNQFPCQIPPWNTHSILFVSIECEWGLGLLAWHLYRIRKSNRCTLCLAMHLHRAWDVVWVKKYCEPACSFNAWEGLNFKSEVPWLEISQASPKNRNSCLVTRVNCIESHYLHHHRKSESNGHATLNKCFGTTMKVVHFQGQLCLGWGEECVGCCRRWALSLTWMNLEDVQENG